MAGDSADRVRRLAATITIGDGDDGHPRRVERVIRDGQKAPDFALPGVEDGTPTIYELFRAIEGSDVVVLWFIPATFLPTATAELRAVEAAGWHEHPGLRVWVLSMDSIYASAAYADRYGFSMPFLGDAASAASYYGVEYDEWEGHYGAPKRAAFLVDTDWRVGVSWVNDDAFEQSDPSPVERVSAAVRERFPNATKPPSVEYDRN